MFYKNGGDVFLSNDALMKIIQDPISHDLLVEFMELNLTLSDGSVVSYMI